jgi:hypothetical protein
VRGSSVEEVPISAWSNKSSKFLGKVVLGNILFHVPSSLPLLSPLFPFAIVGYLPIIFWFFSSQKVIHSI